MCCRLICCTFLINWIGFALIVVLFYLLCLLSLNKDWVHRRLVFLLASKRCFTWFNGIATQACWAWRPFHWASCAPLKGTASSLWFSHVVHYLWSFACAPRLSHSQLPIVPTHTSCMIQLRSLLGHRVRRPWPVVHLLVISIISRINPPWIIIIFGLFYIQLPTIANTFSLAQVLVALLDWVRGVQCIFASISLKMPFLLLYWWSRRMIWGAILVI